MQSEEYYATYGGYVGGPDFFAVAQDIENGEVFASRLKSLAEEVAELKAKLKDMEFNINDKKQIKPFEPSWITGNIDGSAGDAPYTDEPYSADGKFVNVDIADWAGVPGPASFEFKNESEATEAEYTLNSLVKQRNQARRLAVEFRNKINEMENTMTESKSSGNPAVTKLEVDTEAGSERAVETSPIVDGGRYSIISEKILGNQARYKNGQLNGDPAVFSAVAYCGLEADKICDRLNHERDLRIKAEKELNSVLANTSNSTTDENASTEDETIARLKSQIDFEKTSLTKAEKKLEVYNKLLAKSQSLCNMLGANLNESDRERLDAIKERDEALENLAKVKKVSDLESIAFVIAEALDRDAARATVHDNREWAKNMSGWVEGFSSQPSTEEQ